MKLTTAIGREIDPGNPEGAFSPAAISKSDLLVEIATGLAQTIRFSGQLGLLTVAQHSVGVSLLVPSELWVAAKLGLLHDASEAYLGDVPTPLKNLLPDYQALEARYMKAILNRFFTEEAQAGALWTADWMEVHKADRKAFNIEVKYLHKGDFPVYGVRNDSSDRVESVRYVPDYLWSGPEARFIFLSQASHLLA